MRKIKIELKSSTPAPRNDDLSVSALKTSVVTILILAISSFIYRETEDNRFVSVFILPFVFIGVLYIKRIIFDLRMEKYKLQVFRENADVFEEFEKEEIKKTFIPVTMNISFSDTSKGNMKIDGYADLQTGQVYSSNINLGLFNNINAIKISINNVDFDVKEESEAGYDDFWISLNNKCNVE